MPSSSSKSKLELSNLLSSAGEELAMARNPTNSSSTLNVNEEYKKTLRTKSFLDMWSKVHHQIRRTISSIADDDDSEKEEPSHGASPRTDDSSPLLYTKHPELLLEPSQESLVAATDAIDGRSCSSSSDHLQLHFSLLFDYFDVTFRAFMACMNLLASVNRARVHHRSIRHLLIELSSSACFDHGSGCAEFDHLASLIQLENPLHPQHLGHFYSVQSEYSLLMKELTRAHRITLRRLRLVRVTNRATRVVAVSACSIAVVVTLALAVHSVVGIGVVAAAAPVMMTMGTPAAAVGWGIMGGKVRHLERVAAQVDAAARGTYIVGRDMETMSRMVRRAQDEVEHGRGLARMVLRERERQLAREAAREVEGGAAAMEEQLEELEEHVYLCLITINRSRRMVAQELRWPRRWHHY